MQKLLNRVQQQLDNNHAVEAEHIQALVNAVKDNETALKFLANKVGNIDENQFTTPTDVKRRVLSLIADIRHD